MLFLNLFYFYILLLCYQIVYPKSRYIYIYTYMIDTISDRLDVLKLHLNNISRFGGNENNLFDRNDNRPLNQLTSVRF